MRKSKKWSIDAANKMIESLKETASTALSLGDSIKSGISGFLGLGKVKDNIEGGSGFRQQRDEQTKKLAEVGLNSAGQVQGRQGQEMANVKN